MDIISPLYKLSDFVFDLPEELIAQNPAEKRDESKLYLLNRKTADASTDTFLHIAKYLRKGDLLVFNNAKVVPARMFFKRETGARVEVVLARKISNTKWLILTNKTKKLRSGEKIFSEIETDCFLEIIRRTGEFLEAESSVELSDELLNRIGKMPLPPYIKREAFKEDIDRYQTVYAEKSGAVAAPTAGLHFTKELLEKIDSIGAQRTSVTLYVSWGTFAPVRSEDVSKHDMHTESFELSEESAELINKARKDKRRIIAVGTTSLRVLESSFKDGRNVPGVGETDIFIYPPYKVKSIDAMITNFHTPKSTLLMLVCAFAGYETMMAAYRDAVQKRFRFFSYGDSMFIY